MPTLIYKSNVSIEIEDIDAVYTVHGNIGVPARFSFEKHAYQSINQSIKNTTAAYIHT